MTLIRIVLMARSRSTRLYAASTVLLAMTLSVGCSYRSPNTVPPTAMPLSVAISKPYQVRAGDRLAVRFYNTPELDQELTVGPDGRVSLLLVGEMDVRGRAVADLTEEITQRYSTELREPRLTLVVDEYSAMAYYVGGEVLKPGVQDYVGGVTLVEAVMQAGGFRESARLSKVVVVRKTPDGSPVGTVVNVAHMLKTSDYAENIELAPSDVIFVPRSRIASVDLWVKQYFRELIPINTSFLLGYRR